MKTERKQQKLIRIHLEQHSRIYHIKKRPTMDSGLKDSRPFMAD